MNLSYSLILALALGAAQTPQAPATTPEAPTPAAKPANVMTDLELAKIDVLAVTHQRDVALDSLATCQSTLGPLQAQQRNTQLYQQVQTLKTMIEFAHPGMVWNLDKGTLEPKPAAAVTPPADPKTAVTSAPTPTPVPVEPVPAKPKPKKKKE